MRLGLFVRGSNLAVARPCAQPETLDGRAAYVIDGGAL